MTKQRWTAQQVKALRGIKRTDRDAIMEIASRIGRSYAATYSKVWNLTGKTKRVATVAKRSTPTLKRMSKVRVTARYVIVRKALHVSMKNGLIRIKI